MRAVTLRGVTSNVLPRRPGKFAHYARVLHVIGAAEFKLKYAGSALGYLWSVLKPLALFTMMYIVFGRLFNLRSISNYYPVSLLVGIVLFSFFSDATSTTMSSIVTRESLIRKLSFPRLIIPLSATVSAAMTFGVNAIVIVAFLAWSRVRPRWDWFLIVFPLIELYVLLLGVSLILAALFVRFRDIGQIWDLVLQLLFYASPVIYPVGYLPPWARQLVFLNPFTQILQDVRALILYQDLPPDRITAQTALHAAGGRLLPIAMVASIFCLGLFFFKREEPWFAERV